jgi:hypothetical protein
MILVILVMRFYAARVTRTLIDGHRGLVVDVVSGAGLSDAVENNCCRGHRGRPFKRRWSSWPRGRSIRRRQRGDVIVVLLCTVIECGQPCLRQHTALRLNNDRRITKFDRMIDMYFPSILLVMFDISISMEYSIVINSLDSIFVRYAT